MGVRKRNVVQREPIDDPIWQKGHKNAFMFSFTRQNGYRPD